MTATANTVTIQQDGARLYLVGLPFTKKDEAKTRLGMTGSNFDRNRKCWWVGTAKREQAEAYVAQLNGAAGSTAPECGEDKPADSARVYAKVEYKGRNYFVVAESHAANRCRICPLDGPAFWVDMSACNLVKTYPAREYRGRTEYQTIGSIRRFVEHQKAGEAAGLPKCAACGKCSSGLIEDLEDGLMKCRGCCDIPSE